LGGDSQGHQQSIDVSDTAEVMRYIRALLQEAAAAGTLTEGEALAAVCDSYCTSDPTFTEQCTHTFVAQHICTRTTPSTLAIPGLPAPVVFLSLLEVARQSVRPFQLLRAMLHAPLNLSCLCSHPCRSVLGVWRPLSQQTAAAAAECTWRPCLVSWHRQCLLFSSSGSSSSSSSSSAWRVAPCALHLEP
jgi:hypothetical protein